MTLDEAARTFRELVEVIKALRTPGTGCPWDLEQTHHTLRPYLLEEAYEVLEAIDGGDDRAFQEELGDLLLQVVLHAQVAADRSAFSIAEVAEGIKDKMVRRHPHVFGSVQVDGSAEVVRNWEQIKALEAKEKGHKPASPFANVPEALPALQRAQRIIEKAGKLGLPAESPADLAEQVRDRLASLEKEIEKGQDNASPADEDRSRQERELGELLFSVCKLARRLNLHAEDSLRACTRRFVEHFEPSTS